MIEIVRNYASCKIKGVLPDNVHQELRERMRYKKQGYHFSYVYKKGWSDGYVYLFTKKRQTFPSGLFLVAKKVLKKHNLPYQITDLRTEPLPSEPNFLVGKALRDYQQQAEAVCLQHKSGIVKMPTGSGKTLLFTSLLGKLNGLKRIVYVRKLDLMSQTIRCLERDLGVKVGRIGGGVIDIKELSVAMVPTVAKALGEKYIKYAGHFNDDEDEKMELSAQQKLSVKQYIEDAECIIIDECHCTSCESVQMISKHSKKAYYRLGFSATPYRTDGTDILIYAATGPKIVDITASEMIKRGFLVPPRVHFYRVPRNYKKKVPTDYQKVYTEFVVENQDRNDKIVKLTKYLAQKGERPIILVQRQQHGKLLEELLLKEKLMARFIFGETRLSDRQYVLEQFEAGVIDVVIGSTILQEGIDIPCITALINASAGKSASAYYQKIGRAIRPHEEKTRAIIIDFLDDVKWLKDHSKNRMKILQTEPLYELKVQD